MERTTLSSTSPEGQQHSKRAKKLRSSQACLNCRRKKTRCAAKPPHPCPNCQRARLECRWPHIDGRSSEARSRQFSSVPLTGTANVHTAPIVEGRTDGVSSGSRSSDNQALTNGTLALEWLSADAASMSTHTLPVGTPALNPEHFSNALSSFFSSLNQSIATPSSMHGPSAVPGIELHTAVPETKRHVVKKFWWRPHGQTAIAPGLKKITLKVKIEHSAPGTGDSFSPDEFNDVLTPDDRPVNDVMLHLLEVFKKHFGCQFPFIDSQDLETRIHQGTASAFLTNAIAAIAARFSTHPLVALPELEPSAYGNRFYSRCKALLGSILGFPSRETIAACVMLAHVAFANDSESEVWEMTGIAVRMSIDLGLHEEPSPLERSARDADEIRLDKLVFWSVILMDFALAFGVGRCTTCRHQQITRELPSMNEVPGSSPFPFACRMMLAYGPIIDLLNLPKVSTRDITPVLTTVVSEYHALPDNMQWSVTNLQSHAVNGNGSIFLHLHVWYHTILASCYMSDALTESSSTTGSASAVPQRNPAVSANSARSIVEMMSTARAIDPLAYCTLPFTNQAFFVAGTCHVKELEASRKAAFAPTHESTHNPETSSQPSVDVNVTQSILASTANKNISIILDGLDHQYTYWSGIAWISSALRQRLAGMEVVDLAVVTDKLSSFLSLPDAGLIGATARVTTDTDTSGNRARSTDVDRGSYEALPRDQARDTSMRMGLGDVSHEWTFTFDQAGSDATTQDWCT